MFRNIFIVCCLFISSNASAQSALPMYMKSLAKIKGFTDGSGYRVFTNNNSVDHLYIGWPNNKTVIYAAGLPVTSAFVYGDEVYSPDGLSMAGNAYPARISEQYPISQKDYRDWRTRISVGSKNAPGEKLNKDSVWYDDHFAVGISNDGLLIYSRPKLKSKNRWEKNELVKLTGLYTFNLKTGKEQQLIDGTVWTDEQFGTQPYRWGLTPNSKLFYYYDEEGIHFWDLATYNHLYRKMPFSKGFTVSVSDVQSVMQGILEDGYTWMLFINNITGEELYRTKIALETPGYFYSANQLVSINQAQATINFWQLDSGEIKKLRSVVLDTLYMTDGPMDNNDRFKIQVISPQYAAVFNQYDRLYVMGLDYGKSHIVYSDISGQKQAARQASAAVQKAKEDCERNEKAVKFKKGSSILLNKLPYIISSFDCYSNTYSVSTVTEWTENPPYSAATILRYDLKPVKKLMAISQTISATEIAATTLSPQQYEFCEYCHGTGGSWVSDAVSGPVVLVNTTTMKGQYKPLGTMVYNYARCRGCNGSCWHTK